MIRDIIVKLEADSTRNQAQTYAIGLAETFDAHLVGIAFSDYSPLPAYAMPSMPPDILAGIMAENEKVVDASVANFEAAAKRSLLSYEHRVITDFDTGPANAMARLARRFDLSVLLQSGEGLQNNDLAIEAALFGSGRPVMVVPYIDRDGVKLDTVLCCWDGSRAAARAINDAMPFLKKANSVEILIVVTDKVKGAQEEIRGVEIAEHLARHDVKVKLQALPAADIGAGDFILSYASDAAADLIVMGGYGHSRFREFVLGGVTRTVLETMTVPVLLSH